MKTTKQKLFDLFHICVAVYASVLIVGSLTNVVYAQEARNYRLENLERRLADFESLKLDQRVTRIETVLTNLEMGHTDWLNNATGGGIGLLLIRALYIEIRERKRRGFE